jgi:hypothetical protein
VRLEKVDTKPFAHLLQDSMSALLSENASTHIYKPPPHNAQPTITDQQKNDMSSNNHILLLFQQKLRKVMSFHVVFVHCVPDRLGRDKKKKLLYKK